MIEFTANNCMKLLKIYNQNFEFYALILILLSLFSVIFEYFTSIKTLSELFGVIIFLFILLNTKKNFKIFTLSEIVIFIMLSLYLLFYLTLNITENTLYKTSSLLFSISFFFLSKYLINIKNELVFYVKKITSLIILTLLLINSYKFGIGEYYFLDIYISIPVSIFSMAILIYEFVTKKFDHESILHLIFILHSSQIKVVVLLIITFSFLILVYLNDKIKLKNYLKFLFIILFYFLLSYSFSSSSLTNKDSIYFVNIKNIFLKSKQLIIGNNQNPERLPTIGLLTIKQYNYEKNLEELSIETEGPAYSSINNRLTEWQVAKNKIKENKSLIKLTGLEDSTNYYHNIFYGIIVNYGYFGITILIIFIFLILFNIRKDIFQFFLYKIMSERVIFLIIAVNILIFYTFSLPYYHSKFLTLFLGLAYFDKTKNQDIFDELRQ